MSHHMAKEVIKPVHDIFDEGLADMDAAENKEPHPDAKPRDTGEQHVSEGAKYMKTFMWSLLVVAAGLLAFK